MGTGGLRVYFLSCNDKGNAGANPQSAQQPACEHRRVLGVRCLIFISLSFGVVYSR